MQSGTPVGPVVDFDKPRPRPDPSPARKSVIRSQNRRREYLETHPEYFDGLNHEFADPIMYDSLVRRFQSAEERQAEGKAKGYSRVLEGDLLRGEAKLASLGGREKPRGTGSSRVAASTSALSDEGMGETPATKEEGRELWRDFLRTRFVRGQDDDFDYAQVDGNEDYDATERRETQDAWFDTEEPEWHEDSRAESSSSGAGHLKGETGVQDF